MIFDIGHIFLENKSMSNLYSVPRIIVIFQEDESIRTKVITWKQLANQILRPSPGVNIIIITFYILYCKLDRS